MKDNEYEVIEKRIETVKIKVKAVNEYEAAHKCHMNINGKFSKELTFEVKLIKKGK